MNKILPLFLALSTLAAMTAISEEKPLLSFGSDGYPLERIQCEDAKVVLSAENMLIVTLGKDSRWPGITFEGPWDLSDFSDVSMEVTNQGPGAVRLEFLLYDDPKRDWKKAIYARESLSVGESKTLSMQLVRRGLPSDLVVLSGVNGIPLGLPAVRGLNMRHVLQMTISKAQNNSVDTLLIRRTFVSGKYQALTQKDLLPLVDRFGQYCHADWPGKIHNEEELRASVATEAKDLEKYPEPSEQNRFGGWSNGPQLTASGHFRTEKYQGKWHLVDPDGRLFFSLGVNHVNVGGPGTFTPITAERKNWFENLPSPNDWANSGRFYNVRQIYTGNYSGRTEPGFSFLAWNLSRKYGREWEYIGRELASRRLRSWGYNTLGSWSDSEIETMQKLPYTIGVALAGSGARVIGGGAWTLGKTWDPYDPEFTPRVDRLIGSLKNRASSAWCLGIFFDNELYWDEDLGLTALRSDASQPAKQELVRLLQEKYKDIEKLNGIWKTSYKDWESLRTSTTIPGTLENARADLDAFYLQTAEAYFRIIRNSIRRQLPGCLYLGSRFARINALAYQAAAKYCDVVSLNLYLRHLNDYHPPTDADVPLLVSEFHFGALDRGMWGSGLVSVKTQEERAQSFRNYVESALRNPQFVGCHWFEYYDQPLTGRSFDGENYAHGLLTGADVPYRELVDASRQLANVMYPLRTTLPSKEK